MCSRAFSDGGRPPHIGRCSTRQQTLCILQLCQISFHHFLPLPTRSRLPYPLAASCACQPAPVLYANGMTHVVTPRRIISHASSERREKATTGKAEVAGAGVSADASGVLRRQVEPVPLTFSESSIACHLYTRVRATAGAFTTSRGGASGRRPRPFPPSQCPTDQGPVCRHKPRPVPVITMRESAISCAHDGPKRADSTLWLPPMARQEWDGLRRRSSGPGPTGG